jgi:glycosyltransferase involved in cell wall biosynthesis
MPVISSSARKGMEQRKLCYVATIPAVVHAFLRAHIQAAAEKYEVTVICNAVDKHLLDGLKANIVLLPIVRRPSPWQDLLVLFKLIELFRRERFDIVHSHMPKTGLLGMLAAWISGIPIRINTFHGEVWATRKGWRRLMLRRLDKFVGWLATDILLVSFSQQNFLERERVLPAGKSIIIGAGSICGVDPLRFYPNLEARATVRESLGVSQSATVLLFVGRLNRDKGVLDLAAAFDAIAKDCPGVVLVLVGTEEDVCFSRILEICRAEPGRLHYVNFTLTPERYMAASDIFCLPSYREGFGLTLIEAAACGVPAVASRIYGISDALDDGRTGLLFTPGDVGDLTRTLKKLIVEVEFRQQLGEAARIRALDLFASEDITQETIALYDCLIEGR